MCCTFDGKHSTPTRLSTGAGSQAGVDSRICFLATIKLCTISLLCTCVTECKRICYHWVELNVIFLKADCWCSAGSWCKLKDNTTELMRRWHPPSDLTSTSLSCAKKNNIIKRFSSVFHRLMTSISNSFWNGTAGLILTCCCLAFHLCFIDYGRRCSWKQLRYAGVKSNLTHIIYKKSNINKQTKHLHYSSKCLAILGTVMVVMASCKIMRHYGFEMSGLLLLNFVLFFLKQFLHNYSLKPMVCFICHKMLKWLYNKLFSEK